MPSSNNPVSGHSTIVPNEFPLRFKTHSFESHCYNTIGCSVLYYQTYQSKNGENEVSPAPINSEYKKYWGGAPHLGIKNFPPPAVVRWKSMDGVAHNAEVDIGAIFKEQLVLHNVPEQDIPEGWAGDLRMHSPTIFLEVNDHLIRVYMQARIATKQEQIPGNRYSDFRNDLILAWSHTY